jgi:hypothetical protein
MGKDVRIGLVVMDEDELTAAERAAAGLSLPPLSELEDSAFDLEDDLARTRPQLARVHVVRDFEGVDGLGGSWVRFRAVPDARPFAWCRLAARLAERWLEGTLYAIAPWWVWAILLLCSGAGAMALLSQLALVVLFAW